VKVQVITLFPGILQGALSESILGAAQDKGLFSAELVQLRGFCRDKHRQADDQPYGGGGGMVLKPEPVFEAVAACRAKDPAARVIYLSPQGPALSQAKVLELAALPGLILLCGHYEGVDQRALDALVDEELSIGDYVLTGGELAAAVVIDAVARQVPGVLGNQASAQADSFADGLLDFPHYTRPASFEGREVPAVLLGGDHAAVARWRRQQSLLATARKRPDLLDGAELSLQDIRLLEELGIPWKSKAGRPAKPK
jgi:tRNA (guanine37-N1)-methyltransferase